jgi:hypothetical protein
MNTEYKYDVPFNVHLDNVQRQYAQKVKKQNQFKWYHYAIGGIVWFGAISAVTSLLTRNKYYNKLQYGNNKKK